MFKKICFYFFILITCLFFINYNYNNINFPIKLKKPNNYYYTNLVIKNIINETNYKCSIIDTNFYKEKTLSKEEIAIVKKFLLNLNKNNFIKNPKNINKKPLYKLFFTFKDEKYIINIYNKDICSIYPWDGYYNMDFINISNIPISYNLYNLCKYIIPRD
ncbi:hypothetical protein CLOACE_15750 [Clostridium acetireducens DSM 10703]|uniref:Uncharacterized protein n=1 Tax=Clostridium acetireducens DSM 10703 TaxID=1121290 RepID=A0A1E8EXN5_9CLOT|nr:hypothetical protein CLOACE_15750 [Clostridium acetireducens DSM 10703]